MKSIIRTIVAVGLLSAFAYPIAFSQNAASRTDERKTPPKQTGSDAEFAAIRAESKAYVAAFNKRDAKAVAAFWTEDGEYIDDTGHRYAGRDAIEKGYADLFANHAGVKVRIEIDSLRMLSHDTAIEDGRTFVDPPPAGPGGTSAYTAVHVKVDGTWRMASVRDTWIETPADVQSAADLEWLVGSWSAEEHGAKTESTIQWVVDGHFLERRYTTKLVDGTTASGVQLIGWNPQEGLVQSWDFGPDGGHAVGLWTPTDGGWQADVQGITGDGTPTAAVNVLKSLDDNAYVWQSVQRFLGDAALPDTDEIVVKRVTEQ